MQTNEIKNSIKRGLYYFANSWRIIFPKKVEQTVVVLGMHRSGTSLTAGILNSAGVDMGRKQQGATEYNKKGHFENNIIKNLNKKILRWSGGSSWLKLPEEKKLIEAKKVFSKKISRIIKMEQNKVWGWKDPRSVLTLDLFFPFLENPKFIICNRSPDDVARSLVRRNGIKIKEAQKICLFYQKKLENIISKYKCSQLILKFEDFFNNSDETIEKIIEFVGISKEKKEEMKEVIDRKLVTSTKFENGK